jgi:hypothetical protein
MDATGSMSSYIVEARQRIKQIAENLAEGDPKPDARFAWVAFRDEGDEFVTRVHPFTPEFEKTRGYLGATQASGGDAPEAVLEALQAGVTKLSWSLLEDGGNEDVIRLLFLVGDALTVGATQGAAAVT